MPNEPKAPGPAGYGGDEERTPIVIPSGIEDTLRRIANVRLRLAESRGLHDRTDQLLEALERLVRHGGSDAEVRAIQMRAAGHFLGIEEHLRDELSLIFGNLGRAFARQAERG